MALFSNGIIAGKERVLEYGLETIRAVEKNRCTQVCPDPLCGDPFQPRRPGCSGTGDHGRVGL